MEMNETKKKELSTEEVLYRTGIVCLPVGLALAYAITNWIAPILPQDGSSCIFWAFWGMYCPGCGGTRAILALARGDFLHATWYHPLISYIVVMYACFMLSHTLEKLRVPFVKGMKFETWIMYGMLVVLALNFVLKNALKFGLGIVM